MRKLKAIYQTNTLNFRHWSRKGYAAFVSLDKVVRIAVLKSSVSDGLSVKLNVARCISLFEEVILMSDEDEEEEARTAFLSKLMDKMLCVISKPAVAAGSVIDNYLLNNISPVNAC